MVLLESVDMQLHSELKSLSLIGKVVTEKVIS